MLNQLNIFEFVVIYLALGAPLGVYHLATQWSGSLVSTFSFAAVNVCVWPAAALVYAYEHLRDRDSKFGNNATKAAHQLLLLHADKVLSTEDLFAFRADISRYVGICEALNSPIGTAASDGLLEILGPRDGAAARACTMRRNRAKLFLQQTGARINFLDQVAALSSHDPLMLKLACQLAMTLGDHIAADQLKASLNLQAGNIHISSDRISMAA